MPGVRDAISHPHPSALDAPGGTGYRAHGGRTAKRPGRIRSVPATGTQAADVRCRAGRTGIVQIPPQPGSLRVTGVRGGTPARRTGGPADAETGGPSKGPPV
ncbi:hypothetical protein GCM10017752_63700 [Streptomyces roseoviridis]